MDVAGWQHIKCPDCLGQCRRTDWLPPEGLHPQLRQFYCDRCRKSWYFKLPKIHTPTLTPPMDISHSTEGGIKQPGS